MLSPTTSQPLDWSEVPTIIGLTTDMLLRCTVSEGSRRPKGYTPCVEDLIIFLDKEFYPGILKAAAEKYLLVIRPLLEECLPCDEATLAVLADPKKFFSTKDEQTALNRATEYFISLVNKDSPEHTKRAMIAHLEFGLGNYQTAIVEAQFAQSEKSTPNFAEVLYGTDNAAILRATLAAQKATAEILIPLVSEFRRKALADKTPA